MPSQKTADEARFYLTGYLGAQKMLGTAAGVAEGTATRPEVEKRPNAPPPPPHHRVADDPTGEFDERRA